MEKLKKILIPLLSLSVVFSCNSQGKNIVDETINRDSEGIKIEFNFYSSSGGNAIYTINYSNDILYIKKLEPIGNEATDYKKLFTKQDIKKLEQAVSEVIKREDIETKIIFDAWRVELLIDGFIYYNESGITIETLPEDIENLLKFLTESSTVNIDLYGFS